MGGGLTGGERVQRSTRAGTYCMYHGIRHTRDGKNKKKMKKEEFSLQIMEKNRCIECEWMEKAGVLEAGLFRGSSAGGY